MSPTAIAFALIAFFCLAGYLARRGDDSLAAGSVAASDAEREQHETLLRGAVEQEASSAEAGSQQAALDEEARVTLEAERTNEFWSV
jgi:hypothetical protein